MRPSTIYIEESRRRAFPIPLSRGVLSVGLVLDPGPIARCGGATVRLERERLSWDYAWNVVRRSQ